MGVRAGESGEVRMGDKGGYFLFVAFTLNAFNQVCALRFQVLK